MRQIRLVNGLPYAVDVGGVVIPPSGYVVGFKEVIMPGGAVEIQNENRGIVDVYTSSVWYLEGFPPIDPQDMITKVIVNHSDFHRICALYPGFAPHVVTLYNPRMVKEGMRITKVEASGLVVLHSLWRSG